MPHEIKSSHFRPYLVVPFKKNAHLKNYLITYIASIVAPNYYIKKMTCEVLLIVKSNIGYRNVGLVLEKFGKKCIEIWELRRTTI